MTVNSPTVVLCASWSRRKIPGASKGIQVIVVTRSTVLVLIPSHGDAETEVPAKFIHHVPESDDEPAPETDEKNAVAIDAPESESNAPPGENEDAKE